MATAEETDLQTQQSSSKIEQPSTSSKPQKLKEVLQFDELDEWSQPNSSFTSQTSIEDLLRLRNESLEKNVQNNSKNKKSKNGSKLEKQKQEKVESQNQTKQQLENQTKQQPDQTKQQLENQTKQQLENQTKQVEPKQQPPRKIEEELKVNEIDFFDGYYMDIFEEPEKPKIKLTNKEKQLLEQLEEELDGDNDNNNNNNNNFNNNNSTSNNEEDLIWSEETYEKTVHHTFSKFQQRLDRWPTQLLRYLLHIYIHIA